MPIKDKETGKVIGKKVIYEKNKFGGQNNWLMSWADSNKAPKYNSKRQTRLREGTTTGAPSVQIETQKVGQNELPD